MLRTSGYLIFGNGPAAAGTLKSNLGSVEGLGERDSHFQTMKVGEFARVVLLVAEGGAL